MTNSSILSIESEMIDSRLCIQRCVTIEIDWHGNPADNEVRVRVLATEDGVDLGDMRLPVEGLEVVGYRQQVHCGR